MAATVEQIEAEALSLPIEDRARLAEHLIASLDADAETERRGRTKSSAAYKRLKAAP